jgi:carbon storage regulator
MLALTRKIEETIIVNGNIKIKVLDIADGKVKLGIEAPKDVSIYREEVYLDIQNSNKDSVVNQEKMKQLSQLVTKQQK